MGNKHSEETGEKATSQKPEEAHAQNPTTRRLIEAKVPGGKNLYLEPRTGYCYAKMGSFRATCTVEGCGAYGPLRIDTAQGGQESASLQLTKEHNGHGSQAKNLSAVPALYPPSLLATQSAAPGAHPETKEIYGIQAKDNGNRNLVRGAKEYEAGLVLGDEGQIYIRGDDLAGDGTDEAVSEICCYYWHTRVVSCGAAGHYHVKTGKVDLIAGYHNHTRPAADITIH